MATEERWRNRIVGSGRSRPSELIANPRNWRRHPAHQRAAMREALGTVGWVQQIIVNRTTGNVVDGHLRIEEAMTNDDEVPFLEVELSEDEERMVLATLDPLGAMADQDGEALALLIDGLDIPDASALDQLLEGLLPGNGAEAPPSGDVLADLGVTIGPPAHACEVGQVWRVGKHRLAVVDVFEGWPTYMPLLTEGALLVPHPTPIVPLTRRARQTPLVMVQPDPWLAGHLLDKYVEVNGEDEVGRE